MLAARRWFTLLLLLATACGLLPGRGAPTSSPQATDGATQAVTPGTDGTAVGPAGSTATPSGPVALRVWLPPEFTPDVSTESGRLLAEQIQAFETTHPGTAVEIRTKAADGPGGLLSALMAAANAAPDVLPNVVALNHDDLSAAVAGGLVTPLDALAPAALLGDFYPFAQAMGKVNGVWVGLPFAADARVMAYLTSIYPSPPLHWTDLVTGTLVVPAGETSGLTVLTLYMAQGGALLDAAGKPHLDADALARTLELFQRLQTGGTLEQSTLDYADPAKTWEAFRGRRATLAVTSAQAFLAGYPRVDGASATLLPTNGEAPLALMQGWSWVVLNGDPQQAALAAELAGWLLAPEQHGPWTEAAAVLPTRAASLAGWKSTRIAPIVSDIVAHGQMQPASALLAKVGPALRQALTDVIEGRATPFAAASVAAAKVDQP